jgi:hypothetical protein
MLPILIENVKQGKDTIKTLAFMRLRYMLFKDTPVREEIIDLFATQLGREVLPEIRYNTSFPMYLPTAWFSKKAKKALSTTLLDEAYLHYPQTLLLIGTADLPKGKEYLQKYVLNLSKKDSTDSRIFYSHLALARLGDKTSIDYCNNMYKGEISLCGSYQGFLNGLSYTKRPEIVPTLLRFLNTEGECGRNKRSDVRISAPANDAQMALSELLICPNISICPDYECLDKWLNNSANHAKIKYDNILDYNMFWEDNNWGDIRQSNN